MSGQPRRFLIACGTQHYREAPPLPSVPSDLDKVVGFFTEDLAYEPQLTELRHDPTAAMLRDGLQDWLNDPDRRESDVLVFYYTGHGESTGPRHYLLTRDSRSGYPTTAFSTDFITEVLGPQPSLRRVLLLVDTCYSGQAALAAQEAALRQALWQGTPTDRDEGVWVVTASLPKEEATQYAFADAFVTAARDACRTTGPTQRFVALDGVVDRINHILAARRIPQLASYVTAGLATGLPPFLPNPRYDPEVPAGQDLETTRGRRRHSDVTSHWDPKSRGVDAAAQPGRYFTGRSAVLDGLLTWIRDPGADLRGRVVTGRPGSGKSAVLGRVLTVCDADPSTPALVSAACVVRGKTTADLVTELADALGVTARTPGELRTALAARPSPPVVLCDAVDEGVDVRAICRDLLRPLWPVARLVVGCREHVLAYLPAEREDIDLDDPGYFSRSDLVEYVTEVLTATDDEASASPYHRDAVAAREVATHVADRAGHSFLVARVIARTLCRMRQRPAPDQLDSLSRRWTGLGAAFDQDLARYGVDSALVRDVLVPLAWAEGAGLPWENLWAPLASRLAGGVHYTDDDVARVMGLAGAYIVESTDGDRSVYRLYHEEFRRHLRGAADPTDVHREITTELRAHVPTDATGQRTDWFAGHPYLRTHLATHAAAAGLLDDLMEDPAYLLAATPDRLLAALRGVSRPSAVRAADVYRAVQHLLRDTLAPQAAAQLELAALQRGAAALADRTAALPLRRTWTFPWCQWARESGSLILGKLDDAITDLALGRLDERAVAVTCTLITGSLQLWDLAGATLVRNVRPEEKARSVAFADVDGRTVLVTGSPHGVIRLRDPETMTALGRPLRGHEGDVTALAATSVCGDPVLVSAGADGSVRLWDLRSGRALGEPLLRHDSWVDALAIGESNGRPFVVCGGLRGLLRFFDLASREPWPKVDLVGDRPLLPGLRDEPDRITAVAVGVIDGQQVGVTGGTHGILRRWALDPAGPVGYVLHRFDSPLNAVAVGELAGAPVVVCGDDEGRVHRCDGRSGQPAAAALIGHNSRIFAVSVTRLDGPPVVVSAAYDGTVRIWDLRPPAEVPTDEVAPPLRSSVSASRGHVYSVDAMDVDGHPLAFVAEHRSPVRVLDLRTGEQVGEVPVEADIWTSVIVGEAGGIPVAVSRGANVWVWDLDSGEYFGAVVGHTSMVNDVAIGDVDGTPVIVTGSADGVVRVWALDRGEQIAQSPTTVPTGSGRRPQVYAVRLTTIDDRAAVVVGDDDGGLTVWDVGTGASFRLAAERDHGQALAVGAVGGRPIAAVGGLKSVRLWDLSTRRPWGEPLPGHDWVKSVAIGEIGGRPVVVAGGNEGSVRVGDLSGTEPRVVETAVLHVGAEVTALALAGDQVLIGTDRGLLLTRFHPD